jgi:hypothetical protein
MATATGKSLVIGEIVRRQYAANSGLRALVAVHVQELVEQDVKALLAVWPEAPYGICCEGLGHREHDAPIILGTIQSLSRDSDKLGRRDLVMIDEVQLVSRDSNSQYLKLFDTLRSQAPDLHLAGASATPYRLDSGYLHKGEGALFEKIVFSYGIAEGIKDGWLSPLRSKATSTRIDVRGIHVRGGEFIQNELERAANVAEIVEGAVAEIVERGTSQPQLRRLRHGIRFVIPNSVRITSVATPMHLLRCASSIWPGSYPTASTSAWRARTPMLSFAHRWWMAMGGLAPVPMSVAEAIVRRTELGRVLEIQVIRDGQWWRINRRRVLRSDGMLVEIDSKYRSSQITSEITSEINSEIASEAAVA